MKMIGINIRKIREDRGETLRGMAKKMGLTASFLSQIETGKASPSLNTLKNMADILQTTVGSLIGETDKKISAENPVIRQEERKSLKHIGKGIDIYLLASSDLNKQMEPLLFTLDKNASSGDMPYKHFGQEFVLVLKGTLEITLNDTRYVLRQGDSIYFNSGVPHSFKNLDKGSTEAMWVITPPTF